MDPDPSLELLTFPEDVKIGSKCEAYVICQNINFSRPFKSHQEATDHLKENEEYWSDMEVGELTAYATVEKFEIGELEIGPDSRDTNPQVGFYSGSIFYYIPAKEEDLEWLF